MSDSKRVPKLRFKGFTEAWEQCKLGDKGTTFSGLSGKTASDFGRGEASFVTYLNVFQNPIASISGVESVELDFSQISVQYGDIFFTTSSETPDEVGMSSVWLSDKDNVYLNSFCFGYRQKADFNKLFYAYMLRSPQVRKKIVLLAQGISRYNISKKKVMEISIPLSSMCEQSKIGGFFENLDKTITLHQRKLDALKRIKASLLQKMFPSAGEKVPKVRFKGFTEAWEQRKLGDIGNAKSGVGFPDNQQGGSVGIPFFKVSDMNLDGNESEMHIAQNYVTIEQIKNQHWKPITEVPAIFFAKVGAAIMLNRKRLCRIPFLLDNNTMSYSLNQNVWNYEFAKVLFATVDLTSLVQVGALPSYNNEDIESIEVKIPVMNEQKKIGGIFCYLDSIITLHQRKLEKLKNLKKSLLEKMFV